MLESNSLPQSQTQPQLEKQPPEKLAPPIVDGYTLVLLERGADSNRVDESIRALSNDEDATNPNCPCIVARGLTLTDALVGQFELICSDSIAVFIDDNVIKGATPSYLHDLFAAVRKSDEFEATTVHLEQIPDSEDARRFLRQFFGQVIGIGPLHTMPRKKARIMTEWGTRLRITVQMVPDQMDPGNHP